MKLLARALATGRLQIEVEGLQNIPSCGPVLLVARHYHHLFDGLALYQVLPREIHILVTLDWATSRLVRAFMESATRFARWPVVLRADALRRPGAGTRPHENTLFTEKDITRYQRRGLRDSVDLLVAGKVLLIFPEGYPNIDPHYTPKITPEQFLRFKSGFAVIAAAATKRLNAAVPIVPVGLNYSPGRPWLTRVAVGKALYAASFSSRQIFVSAVEEEVKRLSRLSGQESTEANEMHTRRGQPQACKESIKRDCEA